MLQEFKDFINKGNVIEVAVGIILALAFTPIVTAIVDGVLLQIVALVFDQPDFSSLTIDISDTPIYYGRVIATTIDFIVIAAVVFLVVKAYNMLTAQAEAEGGPDEIELLTEIRDSLRSRG